MPIKRYAKKAFAKGKKYAKKAYTTRTGGVRVNRLAKDLAMVKRQLNVEHKHIDFTFGARNGADAIAQRPTKSVPVILPLITPVRGTAFNNRVGNQIRVVHMTSKLMFNFQNNSDLIQRTSVRAQIVFAKNASDIPTIDELYEVDSNGHYTPMSMSNTQEYAKFLWIKSQDHRKSHLQPTNRYQSASSAGTTSDPTGSGPTQNVTAPASQSLNDAQYYSNKMSKVSIRMFFKNGTEEVEQMKPYLLLRSDVIDASTDYDPVIVSGIIRMTYVDN
jgi:hypothetical protein